MMNSALNALIEALLFALPVLAFMFFAFAAFLAWVVGYRQTKGDQARQRWPRDDGKGGL